MIRLAALATLVLAVVALPAVAFGKFIQTDDYESIQLGGGTKPERPSMLPGGSVRVIVEPPVVAPAPRAVVVQPVAAVTRAPAQRHVRKPRLARGERHVRSRVAYSAPPPAGSPTVAPAPQVTPAAIETEGTSGPSLALLIAAITALGAVAVLILVVRNDRLPAA